MTGQWNYPCLLQSLFCCKTMINELNMTIRKLVWMQLSERVKSAMCSVWIRVIHFWMSQLVWFLAISPSWLFSWDPVENMVHVLNEFENIVWGLCFCMSLYVYLIFCSIDHQRLTLLSLRSDPTHSLTLTPRPLSKSKNISHFCVFYL